MSMQGGAMPAADLFHDSLEWAEYVKVPVSFDSEASKRRLRFIAFPA
jgi:hypothetical protein